MSTASPPSAGPLSEGEAELLAFLDEIAGHAERSGEARGKLGVDSFVAEVRQGLAARGAQDEGAGGA